MAFFGWRPHGRDELAETEASQADAEAEISKPLILPSRGVSRSEDRTRGEGDDHEDDMIQEEELPLLYKDEVLRRRYQRHAIVTLAVGLVASVTIASVLFGLTYRYGSIFEQSFSSPGYSVAVEGSGAVEYWHGNR